MGACSKNPDDKLKSDERRTRPALLLIALALVFSPSAFAASGGPDAYGYIWSDQTEYVWIDPDGGEVVFLGDDAWLGVNLGFTFGFYGASYDSTFIVSNGYLTFPQEENTYVNQCPLPDPTEPNGSIYFYWHDLIPSASGLVSYKRLGEAPYRHFMVSFENVAFFGYPEVLTAQVILTETVNWTQIHYMESGQGGTLATIGIENQDGTIGLTALCNEANLDDETALYFGLPGAQNVRVQTSGLGLRLLWDDPSGTEFFLVESRPFGETAWTALGETTETSIADPRAEECFTYDYRITALAGEIGRAAPVLSTQTFFPLAPADLEAVDVDGACIELFWKDNSDCEDGYAIERRVVGSFFAFLTLLPEGAQSYTDESPPANVEAYRVKAVSGLLGSDYSGEAPISAHLMTVSDLTAEAYSDTKIALHWTDGSTNEDGYAVERRLADVGDEDFVRITNVGPDSESYLDFGLQSATAYAYRIRPYTTLVSGEYSNAAEATTKDEGTPPEDDDSAAPDDSGPADGGADDADDSGNGACCGL